LALPPAAFWFRNTQQLCGRQPGLLLLAAADDKRRPQSPTKAEALNLFRSVCRPSAASV